jgi:hypothetical protein
VRERFGETLPLQLRFLRFWRRVGRRARGKGLVENGMRLREAASNDFVADELRVSRRGRHVHLQQVFVQVSKVLNDLGDPECSSIVDCRRR